MQLDGFSSQAGQGGKWKNSEVQSNQSKQIQSNVVDNSKVALCSCVCKIEQSGCIVALIGEVEESVNTIHEFANMVYEFTNTFYDNVIREDVLHVFHDLRHDPFRAVRVGEAANPGLISEHTLDIDDSEASQCSEGADAWVNDLRNEFAEEWYNECLFEDPMEYIPAKKFEGMKQGMAFKMGEKGLGYYKDGPTIISIEETLVDQY